jgi:hypothetical protein
MKRTELLSVAALHVVLFAVALWIIMKFKPDAPEVAFVIAAIAGTWTGAFFFHRRNSGTSNYAAKAALGGTMAAVCIIEAIVVQGAWSTMKVPEVSIPISAIGTFGFPFVLFDKFEKAFRQQR